MSNSNWALSSRKLTSITLCVQFSICHHTLGLLCHLHLHLSPPHPARPFKKCELPLCSQSHLLSLHFERCVLSHLIVLLPPAKALQEVCARGG